MLLAAPVELNCHTTECFKISLVSADWLWLVPNMYTGEHAASVCESSTLERIPRYAVAAFFAFLLVGFWAVTRVELLPDGRLEVTSPHVVSGDEPHHLLVLNSILFDHDLQLQDDYERAKLGLDAGGITLFDHHTIIVNRRSGRHGTWFEHSGEDDLARGPDVYEVSSHPVAYPALLAALIFPVSSEDGRCSTRRQPGHGTDLWLGAIFTFLLARKVGMGRGYALLATALLALGSPWLAYTRSFFVEPVIGLSAAIALYALEGGRPLLAASAAAAAAIFKPPLAVIGGGFIVDRIQQKRWRELILILSVLSLSGLALMTFNYWLARTPVISGNGSGPWPLGSNSSHDFYQLGDTLIGSAHGLFIWAPWTIFAIFPIGQAFCSAEGCPRFLREMSLPMTMQLVVLTASNFDSGACYGPRYWVPFLPWMAVATVTLLKYAGWSWKLVFLLLAIVSTAISIAGALRYPQMFSLSPWFLWHTEKFQG